METKPKVDVAAIMARAKNSVKEVKTSTEKVESKKDTYRTVPGFSKFEFNGMVLRNVKTKNIISKKTGRDKWQLFDDHGKSHNLSKDDINKLFPPVEVAEKPIKPSKEPKIKPIKKMIVETSESILKQKESVSNLSESDIASMDCPTHKKIYLLHLKGKSNKEIHQITKSPIPSIARDIWRYKTGKTTLEL